METRFVLIRHAQSLWNAADLWQGQADPPLSPAGRRQAEALARELADEPIDLLLVSDLVRARQTAAPLARRRGLVVTLDPRLRELDVGDWAGRTRDEIQARDPETLGRFEANDPDVRAGGGESRREIRERVRGAFAGLSERHRGAILGVVTHLGVVRALLPGVELPNAGWVRAAAGDLAAVDDGTDA